MKDVIKKTISLLTELKCRELIAFNQAATKEQINQVENEFGLTFPQNLIEIYQIFNGTHGIFPFYGWNLLSLESVLETWRINKDLLKDGIFGDNVGEPLGPVKAYIWSNKWIPIFSNDASCFLCLDFDPPPLGRNEQLITYLTYDKTRQVLSYTYEELFTAFYNDLKDENIIIDKYGCITKSKNTRLIWSE
jgi:cell wall assembly regulator SMI1